MIPAVSFRGQLDDVAMLTSGQLAVLLRVTRETVSRWHIASMKTLGGHSRYQRESLAGLIPAAGDPQLLNAREAAAIMGVHERTVRVWISRNRIRAWQLPSGRMRVARTDVDLILAGRADEVHPGGAAALAANASRQGGGRASDTGASLPGTPPAGLAEVAR